jgi:hypothetical protein
MMRSESGWGSRGRLSVAEVLRVSPVLVELARKQVSELESAGKTPPVALRRIAEARSVSATNRPPLTARPRPTA